MSGKCFSNISQKKLLLVALLIMLVNLLCRGIGLAGETLYLDEASSLFRAQQPLRNIIEIYKSNQNPPGYFILLHFWILLFGVQAFAAKFLSVLFSSLTASLLFLFLQKKINLQTALLASVFFLFSFVQLFYSHEARAFALLGFLIMLSLYVFFAMLKNPSYAHAVLWALVNAYMLFCHYMSVFVPLIQMFFFLIFFRKYRNVLIYIFLAYALLLLIFLPWLGYIFHNMPVRGEYWLPSPNLNTLFVVFKQLSGNGFLFFAGNILILLSLLSLFVHKLHLFSSSFDKEFFLFFLLMYYLPVFLSFLIAQYTPVFQLKYVLYASLAFYILLSMILYSLKIRLIFRLLLMLVFLLPHISLFDLSPDKYENWNTAVPKIKALQGQNDLVLVSPYFKDMPFAYYYDHAHFRNWEKMPEKMALEHVFFVRNARDIQMNNILSKGSGKIIQVESHANSDIQAYILDQEYKLCNEFQEGDIRVHIFQKKGSPCYQYDTVCEIKPEMDTCLLWEAYEIIEKNSGTHWYRFYCDFDNISHNCRMSPNFMMQEADTLRYSCVCNADHQLTYVLGFSKDLLGEKKSFDISFLVKGMDMSHAHLVISAFKPDMQSILWRTFPLSEYAKASGAWEEIYIHYKLHKEVPQDALFQIYIMNTSEKNVFVDIMDIFVKP
jgi:mannosyltransferase